MATSSSRLPVDDGARKCPPWPKGSGVLVEVIRADLVEHRLTAPRIAIAFRAICRSGFVDTVARKTTGESSARARSEMGSG